MELKPGVELHACNPQDLGAEAGRLQALSQVVIEAVSQNKRLN